MSELTDALRLRVTWPGAFGVKLLAISENERDAILTALERAAAAYEEGFVAAHRIATERGERVETALTTLVEAAGRLPLDSWAEDHRPDSVDGCTHCGWDDISKCVYTAAHDTQEALEAATAALGGHDD